MIPSISQIGKAIDNLFVLEDWHSFGIDYDMILIAWYKKFVKNRDNLKYNYSDRFFRIWKYFLLSSPGSFRASGHNQLWQIVLSKNVIPGVYQSVR